MPDNQTVSHSQSTYDQQNNFNFLALVQFKTEQFSLKTYKISEQQVNPKVLSVADSCHYNENSKEWETSFIDKCLPLGSCPNKSSPPCKTSKVPSPLQYE